MKGLPYKKAKIWITPNPSEERNFFDDDDDVIKILKMIGSAMKKKLNDAGIFKVNDLGKLQGNNDKSNAKGNNGISCSEIYHHS